jgi:CRP/FNR family cyclic AMP-dependent transcriptional regulator
VKAQADLDRQRDQSLAVCHVLREDFSLAEIIPVAQRERAIEECIAVAAQIPRGRWGGQKNDVVPSGIGLLVLRGLLIRRVAIGTGYGVELLGEGDLLRPWQGEDAQPALAQTTRWHVLEPARVAVLDHRVAVRFSHYPELTGRLVARALERSRHLAVNMAIVHQSRVQTRLHMLLWHLANRWGYVRPDGIVLPLPLTHSVLADLVAARRPSVSIALAELARLEVVQRVQKGWLIAKEPAGEPAALEEGAPASVLLNHPGACATSRVR